MIFAPIIFKNYRVITNILERNISEAEENGPKYASFE